jgi:hypothetical protein
MSKFLKLIEEHDPATKREMENSSKAKKSKFLEILEGYDPANEQKMEDAFKAKMLLHEKKKRLKKKKYAEEEAYEINPSDMAADITDRYKQKPMWKRALKSVIGNGEAQVAKETERQAKELHIPLAQFIRKQTDAAKAKLQKAMAKVKINQ